MLIEIRSRIPNYNSKDKVDDRVYFVADIACLLRQKIFFKSGVHKWRPIAQMQPANHFYVRFLKHIWSFVALSKNNLELMP